MSREDCAPKVSLAGLSSVDLANVMEPPLQRKRRTELLQSTNSDEYILLGEQDKFVQNVKYRVKPTPVHVKPQPKKSMPPSPPNAPRAQHPAPKVVVDTGAIHNEPKRAMKTVHHAQTQIDNGARKETLKPLTESIEKMKSRNKENLKPSSTLKPIKPSPALKPSVSAGLPKQSESIVPMQIPTQPQMNGVAQTDVAINTEPSVAANYAMAYRAGIAPKRPMSLKRNSEYQSRFQWKDPVGSSPMLAAEQIVYNSNPNLGFSIGDVVPKTTEYRLQFQQPTEIIEGPTKDELVKAAAEVRRQKIKRSKSVDSALRVRPAGVASGLINPLQQKAERLKNVMNPQTLHFPHGKQRIHRSEYYNNFKAPSDFVYQEGAWRGADPPHLNQGQIDPESSSGLVQSSVALKAQSWFHEVTELRERAMEYRRRARGTHFSREHLAQLYAQQAKLWDSVSSTHQSESESSIAALSLEGTPTSVMNTPTSVEATPRSTQSEPPTTPRNSSGQQCWTDECSDLSVSTIRSQVDSRHQTESSTSSELGRVPTPKVHHTPASSSYTRHHLDRTTPSVGGALLTSPQKGQRLKEKIPELRLVKHKPGTIAGQIDHDTSVQQDAMLEVQCTCGEENLTPAPSHAYLCTPTLQTDISPPNHSSAPPTLGIPTHDSHVLLDETRSFDEPLQSQFVHSPLMDPPARRELWQLKHPDVSIPSTVMEQTERMIPTGVLDDDVLSVSAMSVASSSSLASEVLERAKNRRDKFWTKG